MMTDDDVTSSEAVLEMAEAIVGMTRAVQEQKASPAPEVNVAAPTVNVSAPEVRVSPQVHVPPHIPCNWTFHVTERDMNGRIKTFTATPSK